MGADCEMSDDDARAFIDVQFGIIDVQCKELEDASKGEQEQYKFWLQVSLVLAAATAIVVFLDLFKFLFPSSKTTLFDQMLPTAIVFVAFLTAQTLSELLDTSVRKKKVESTLNKIKRLKKVAQDLVEKARSHG
jgi:hypothetical protein